MFKTPVFWEYHILPGHRLFRYMRNGPAFLCESFHHTRGPSLMISAWLITSSAHLRPAAPPQQRSAVQCRSRACPGVRCGTVRCCAVLWGAVACCALVSVLLYILLFCWITIKKHPQPAATYSSQQRSAVRCRALLRGAVLFHAALYFLSNIQQYQVYDGKYQVPGTGTYVFLHSSLGFL